ncbi:hypothetical protein CYY_000009 [Polysphondylium violaceum]|uniref:Activator of Hsp90 ATPase AHSA1-like N-terminal domain-containing protein n=1 Tax=Polysphondylium violaceum TaxID=133409 RepID=A0A8J4Q2A7_9MYCE|nr:hypothetical protein CYY_000009 [Polysphondylium violaceum]
MAKVGEGDPRWIVENRQDGHNVNNWHWSEKDCLPWSKNSFNTLLANHLIYQDEQCTIKTTNVASVEGECVVNNRKGKSIFLYELKVKVNWEATFTAKEEDATSLKIAGEFLIPYIADENNDEAPTVKYSTSTASNDENKKKIETANSIIKTKGVPIIQKQCQLYVKNLKDEFTQKRTDTPPPTQSNATTTATTTPSSTTTATTTTPTPKPKTTDTKTLNIKEEFQTSPMDAYDAFVNPNKIRAYTQSEVIFENQEGGKFSFYGGSITGVNKTLSPGSKIVQTWRLDTWPKGVESTVTINFSVEGKPCTKVDITQTGIPIEEFEKTQEGWHRNILERMKQVFGFNAKLF